MFLFFSGFTWLYPRLLQSRQPLLGAIYEEPRGVPKVFLENEIRYAVPYTEYATRKTGNAMEVVRACLL